MVSADLNPELLNGLLNGAGQGAPEFAEPAQISTEMALEMTGSLPKADEVVKSIETKWRGMAAIHTRMLKDWDLYRLKSFEPIFGSAVAPEDAYTTNAPRVMAEKVIAFISATEVIIRVNSDQAQEAQEEQNDRAEQLAIGLLENINRRRRRSAENTQSLVDELAWYSVVRGRYVAARAFLSKDEYGNTIEDILPLDPYNLIVQPGRNEPLWAAYRMSWTVQEIKDAYPDFDIKDEDMLSDDEERDVWEYYVRKPNPFHNPNSNDPFDRHPYVYLLGVIIDDKWAVEPYCLYTLNFPVVISPVGSTPRVAHHESGRGDGKGATEDTAFGESIFAENRMVWEQFNQMMSYANDMVAKASQPRIKVYSSDGTKELDEGALEKGAEINVAVANNEEVENFQEADASRVAVLFLNALQQDAVAGGLPPQAFGLLDKPLSSVALRQLGNNLEHRVTPRMKAVAACLEGCIENMLAQFETGGFAPVTVSGRQFDNQRFSNRVISPEGIYGHDPVLVKMELALPEDRVEIFQLAQMAMAPTAAGEPLASLEWTREHVLKMESSKLITRQNREAAGVMQDPIASALEQFSAYVRDGNQPMAMIWYDRLETLSMQRQVEGNMMKIQLMQILQQMGQPPNVPMDPLNAGVATGIGSTIDQGLGIGKTQRVTGMGGRSQSGMVPQSEFNGIGNRPSPQAGYNTTAPRQRDTGLLGPDGNPYLVNDEEY